MLNLELVKYRSIRKTIYYLLTTYDFYKLKTNETYEKNIS